MKKALIVAIIALSFSACKKDNAPENKPTEENTPPQTSPVTSGKLISQMQVSSGTVMSTTKYVYNSKNQLTESHYTSSSNSIDVSLEYNDDKTLKKEIFTSPNLSFTNDFFYENSKLITMIFTQPAVTKNNYTVKVKNDGSDLVETTYFSTDGVQGSSSQYFFLNKNLIKLSTGFPGRTPNVTTYTYSDKVSMNYSSENGQGKTQIYPEIYPNEMISKSETDGTYITNTTYSYTYDSDGYPIKMVATIKNDERLVNSPVTYTVTTIYTYINKK